MIVLEREAGLDARPRDWSLLIHWALPLMANLLPDDVAADLPQAMCNPHINFDDEAESLPVYNGLTGELLFQSATPGARRITRQKLRRLLARDLDIRWGTSLSRLVPGADSVRIEFDDGAAAALEVDYVLGADGTSSKVRELLVGSEAARPILSGFMFASCFTQYCDLEKVNVIVEKHPVAAVMMGTSAVAAVGGMFCHLVSALLSPTYYLLPITHYLPTYLYPVMYLDGLVLFC